MARRSPAGSASRRKGGASSGLKHGEQGRRNQGERKGAQKAKQKEEKIRAYAGGLTEKERVALAVRDELYDGSWGHMREDLEARKQGRTYVFRLTSRIEEDLKTIRKLSVFERRHSVNLSGYLKEGR